jgi:hypothetical protein
MSVTLITFTKNIAGTKVKGRGIPIGNNLIVSYAFGSEDKYQIFQSHNGKLFISTTFTSLDDCKEMAKWLNETYQDFFCLWETYPDADIISLSKWSVRNGIKIFELMKEIKNKLVNKDLLSWSWNIANENEKEWMRA